MSDVYSKKCFFFKVRVILCSSHSLILALVVFTSGLVVEFQSVILTGLPI